MTKKQRSIAKRYVKCPAFWIVVHDGEHHLHIRNWITGENRVITK